ncbi:MAG: hypothetical protein ABIC40_06740 [bacterium]
MWLILIFILVGFTGGYFFNIPFESIPGKFLALLFLGMIDSFTYGLARDLEGSGANDKMVLTRFVAGLIICGFIIYFGEKSKIDLYMIGLMPLAIGFALNMYKFLPK